MKIPYSQLNNAELEQKLQELKKIYDDYVGQNLALDMSRGKPNTEQLDLTMGMLDTINSTTGTMTESGFDCRNYGILSGIPEARKLIADILECEPEEVMIGGNSSLNLMFDSVSRAFTLGVVGSDKPWCKEQELIFLCPSPGYDRHFSICQHFGIKMIPIEMHEDGPDMDDVEYYVNNNPAVKGIWCVPKYSNPTGITYSDEVVRRFANLEPAAPDFRIFWDNAYVIHEIYEDKSDKLLNLLDLLKENGKENMLFEFTSTSKISFAGAGISAMCASKENIALIEKQLTDQTIGFNKLTQLMHVRYFKNAEGMKAHMKKHAALLRPKFTMVNDILEKELGELDIAKWTHPNGGYFISLDVNHCAKRVVNLCANAGVKLTDAGATYPYKLDPNDSNIRIAPSYPTLDELEKATELLALCVKIASIEYYLTTNI